MRIEQLEARAAEEFGVDVETLLAEYGPASCRCRRPRPRSPRPRRRGEPAPRAVPYDRAAQEKRAAKAERDLALLGKVNPLALEEFAALEERYKFLSDQLEDLKATRRDLLTVVKEVDDRILEVFAAAYHDMAREFESVFADAVPGRRGPAGAHRPRRHAGHRHRGRGPAAGQEGQAAVAAVRRRAVADRGGAAGARSSGPGPARSTSWTRSRRRWTTSTSAGCSTLIEQLRENSQLIIITHQKRTMEIADALYGVTMRGDGVTQVISQRLRELQTA